MDQELIQQHRDQQASDAEKRKGEILDVTLSKGIQKQVATSGEEIQQTLVSSVGALVKFLKSHQADVTVTNQVKFPDSVSTPDVAKVVTAVTDLKKAVSQKETDFTEVIKSLNALSKGVADLPKPVDTVTVKNQPDYKPEFETLNKSIESIDLAPVINVPEPKVTVNNDFKEVIGQLTDLLKAVKGIKMPEVPSTDLSEVVKATKAVQATINNLRFPVPNYILPFKDSSGKAVQAQLDSNGALVSTNTLLAMKVIVVGSVTYVGNAPAGSAQSGAVWRAQKIDETSGSVVTWADGNTNFDNVATDLTALSYS